VLERTRAGALERAIGPSSPWEGADDLCSDECP
jgi:hypothetical protein